MSFLRFEKLSNKEEITSALNLLEELLQREDLKALYYPRTKKSKRLAHKLASRGLLTKQIKQAVSYQLNEQSLLMGLGWLAMGAREDGKTWTSDQRARLRLSITVRFARWGNQAHLETLKSAASIFLGEAVSDASRDRLSNQGRAANPRAQL
jgi:hypothetical protein